MTTRLVIFAAIVLATLLAPACCHAQQDLSEDNRDWVGMRRDLYHLIGWQVVVTAIVYHAPFEFSNWNEEEKDNLGFEQWGNNVTDPVWDEDHWAVNYVIHPYWGAGYYIRGRERGFSRRESFWVSALYSTVYEFGIESFLEQPSIQDLIVTPVAGTALGFYFEKVRDRIRSRPGPLSFSDRLKLGLTDPLGALNRGVDRLLGIDEKASANLTIGFRPIRPTSRFRLADDGRFTRIAGGATDGYQLTFSYRW
jgi:hypothetical protein